MKIPTKEKYQKKTKLWNTMENTGNEKQMQLLYKRVRMAKKQCDRQSDRQT